MTVAVAWYSFVLRNAAAAPTATTAKKTAKKAAPAQDAVSASNGAGPSDDGVDPARDPVGAVDASEGTGAAR